MTTTHASEGSGRLFRAWRFLQKPLAEKSRSVFVRWTRIFPNIPAPILLPFGAWWLVRKDTAGQPISEGRFETAEVAFVDRFLRPGMTVLDLGAHHGYYTLLASKRVGAQGKVFAFEPSPRERRALRLHLILNRCANVSVQGVALGDEEAKSDLYVVQGIQTGCNSLRPPIAVSGTSRVSVRVTQLDGWLQKKNIQGVDFIKLDVEGGELAVLKGAERLLARQPRPIILAEVQDLRTRPWGYPAKDILWYLAERRFKWFSLLEDGSVQEMDLSPNGFEGNFVACPDESVPRLDRLRAKSESPTANVHSR
jgi:FkbM family methyltransferase